eukprot:2593554-Prymnesium_polylepis.1
MFVGKPASTVPVEAEGPLTTLRHLIHLINYWPSCATWRAAARHRCSRRPRTCRRALSQPL